MVLLTAKKIHMAPLLSPCPRTGLNRVCTPDRAYRGDRHRSDRGLVFCIRIGFPSDLTSVTKLTWDVAFQCTLVVN